MSEKAEKELLSVQENLLESQNYEDQVALQEPQQVFEPTPTASAEDFSTLPSAKSQQSVPLQLLNKAPMINKACQEPQQVMKPELSQKLIDNQLSQESQVLIKHESNEELPVSKPIPELQFGDKEDVTQENIGDQPIQESEETENEKYIKQVTAIKAIQESHCGVEQFSSDDVIHNQPIQKSEQLEKKETIEEVAVSKMTPESQHEIKNKVIEVAVESDDEITDNKQNRESQHGITQDFQQEIAENQPTSEQSLTIHEQMGSKDHDEAKQLKKEEQTSETVEPSENGSHHSDDKKDVEELSWSQISEDILKINTGVHANLDMLIAAYNHERTESDRKHQEFKKRFIASFQREIDMIKCDVNREETCVEELEDVADSEMERTVELTDDEKSLEDEITEADEKLRYQEEHAAAKIGASLRKERLFDAREVRLNDRAQDTDVREFNYKNDLAEEEETEEEIKRQLDEEELHLKNMLERKAYRWKSKNLRRFFSFRKSGSHEIRNGGEERALLSTEVSQNTSARAQAHDPSDNLEEGSSGKMALLLKCFRRSRKQTEPIVSNIDIEVPCSSKGYTPSNTTDGNDETVSRSPSKVSKLVMKLKRFSRGKKN